MEIRSVRIVVSGKVQGVFYRKSTKDQADYLKLNGWVKNQPDGSVLIEAEGPKENIQKLIDWCRIGSPASVVDHLAIEEIKPLNGNGFAVKYF